MKRNEPFPSEYDRDFDEEMQKLLLEEQAYERRSARSDDIFKSFVRYSLWCMSVLLLAFCCNLLAIKISGIQARSLAALWYKPDGLALRNSLLFYILPITLYWVILLCGPWNDPFRSRFYGIIAGVIVVFLVSTFTFILYAAEMAQGADPTADLFPMDALHMKIFLIAAVFFELPLFLCYFIGPYRLARSKWKDEDADMTAR